MAPRDGGRLVGFRVRFSHRQAGFDEDLAMMDILSSPPVSGVHLREGSSQRRYISGDYEDRGEFWVGTIMSLSSSRTVDISTGANGRVRLSERSTEDSTINDRTSFAYNPVTGLLFVEETSEIPGTRLRSYVRAVQQHKFALVPPQYHIELVPLVKRTTVRAAIAGYENLERVDISFRHSQSPGNADIDNYVDELNAATVDLTIRGEEGGINVPALVNQNRQEGKALNHIELNPDNGLVKLIGVLKDGTRWAWNSGKQQYLSWFVRSGELVAAAREAQKEVLENGLQDPEQQ